MKPNKRKIFGIGAVVLMILVAFSPLINGVQFEKSDQENEINVSNFDKIADIEFERCEFTRTNLLGTKALYEIDWSISCSWECPEGKIPIKIRIGDRVFATIEVQVPFIPYPEIWGDSGTYDLWLKTSDFLGEDEEFLFAGAEVALDIGCDIDHQIAKYWRDDDEYKPLLSHLKKTLPINRWIKNTEIFEFSSGTLVKIPIFKNLYKSIILPVLLASNRLGWVGEFAQLVLIDFGIALFNFLYEFFEVAACIALICAEIMIALELLIALFTSVATGQIEITWFVVSGLFGDLSAIAWTFKTLLENIDDLPISPDDPLRIALAEAADACWEFLYSRPWYDDVTIKGSVDRCGAGEKVTISCREVIDKDVPGISGMRTIEPFGVNTSWNWEEYKDGLVFRRCQVTIEGDEHVGQELKSPKLLSYCAPQGTLKIISSFQKRSRSVGSIIFRNFQNFFKLHPNMFPVLQRLLNL